ncbi:MAG: DUF4097 family beta strand repeat-containing protein [Ilumatobacteraceae bacterium]
MSTNKRTEQFPVGDRTNLIVELRSGAVEVRTGAAGRAVVTLDSDRADEWNVIHLGDSLAIQPFDRPGSRGKTVRIFVEVPAGSDVEVRGISADVTFGGILGEARVHTRSGDVRIDSAARLEVNSVSGDVRANSVVGEASLTTVSGDIDIREVGGRLSANTTSGDVRVSSVGDDVLIGTVSGDVRVDRVGGASVGVKCISGDVTIGLPAGIRVEPEISTLSGRTTLPKPSGLPHVAAPRVVRVRLRTVSGDISIERVTG